MIILSKNELYEMATIFMVANTPNSLLKGLLDCRAVNKMRSESQPEELWVYYDSVCARAKRSATSMALAHGVLVSILFHNRPSTNCINNIDATRLSWGPHIRDIANVTNPPTQIHTIFGTSKAQIKVLNPPPSGLILPSKLITNIGRQ